MGDDRAIDLGQVETFLRRKYAYLPRLRLLGQAHYSASGFAFIVIFGVDDDAAHRRAIRAEASELLQSLGHDVHLEAGRDVYELNPERPCSQHEELQMLSTILKRLFS